MSNYNSDEWLNECEGLGQDSDLTMFVDMVNKWNISMGITIFAGGTLVTGLLVSHDVYLETQNQVIRNALQKYRDNQEDGEPISDEKEDDVEPVTRVPRYFHLKDPEVLRGNLTFGGNSHPYARFKIAAIDGWLLGSGSIS
jgi:hypothetical protein